MSTDIQELDLGFYETLVSSEKPRISKLLCQALKYLELYESMEHHTTFRYNNHVYTIEALRILLPKSRMGPVGGVR